MKTITARMAAPTAAQISCIVTNCRKAPRTLAAQENASLIGGSYHQPMIDGPTTLEIAKPMTAPTASETPTRNESDAGRAGGS